MSLRSNPEGQLFLTCCDKLESVLNSIVSSDELKWDDYDDELRRALNRFGNNDQRFFVSPDEYVASTERVWAKAFAVSQHYDFDIFRYEYAGASSVTKRTRQFLRSDIHRGQEVNYRHGDLPESVRRHYELLHGRGEVIAGSYINDFLFDTLASTSFFYYELDGCSATAAQRHPVLKKYIKSLQKVFGADASEIALNSTAERYKRFLEVEA